MKKPEKYTCLHCESTDLILDENGDVKCVGCGQIRGMNTEERASHNEACDLWETYHKWRMEQLPSQDELEMLVGRELRKYPAIITVKLKIAPRIMIAKAISKRLRGEV